MVKVMGPFSGPFRRCVSEHHSRLVLRHGAAQLPNLARVKDQTLRLAAFLIANPRLKRCLTQRKQRVAPLSNSEFLQVFLNPHAGANQRFHQLTGRSFPSADSSSTRSSQS